MVFAVRLTKMLNTSERLRNKNSFTWWYVFKTSWRCFQDVFARLLEDVLKTSWRCLEDVLKTLEDVWIRQIYSSWPRGLEDVFWRRMINKNIFAFIKTSWRRLSKTKAKDVFKTSSRRLYQDECLLGILFHFDKKVI